MSEKMGKHSEHKFLSKKYIWDRSEKNIIYKQLSQSGQYCINIIITSNSIKKQMSKLIT